MNRKQLVRLAIIVISCYMIVTTVHALIDLWRAGDKLTTRQKTLASLKLEQQELEKRQVKVESRAYMEKVARDELGLSKPGEQTFIIPEELLAGPVKEASAPASPNWEKWAKLIVGNTL